MIFKNDIYKTLKIRIIGHNILRMGSIFCSCHDCFGKGWCDDVTAGFRWGGVHKGRSIVTRQGVVEHNDQELYWHWAQNGGGSRDSEVLDLHTHPIGSCPRRWIIIKYARILQFKKILKVEYFHLITLKKEIFFFNDLLNDDGNFLSLENFQDKFNIHTIFFNL